MKAVAEERVGKKAANLRVLNSYWVNQDATYKYYEFICATNEETRQEPGTYLKVLKGLYYHGEEVDSYDAALKVKGVGPMHARKCASAARWRCRRSHWRRQRRSGAAASGAAALRGA